MRFGIAALIAGFLLDLLLGDPEWLYHPVRLIGKYISFAEKHLRARGGNLRKSAVILTGSTVFLTMASTALILWLLHLAGRIPLFIGMTLMNWMGIAVRCMAKEARDVERSFDRGIDAARKQVARIVGRDTEPQRGRNYQSNSGNGCGKHHRWSDLTTFLGTARRSGSALGVQGGQHAGFHGRLYG